MAFVNPFTDAAAQTAWVNSSLVTFRTQAEEWTNNPDLAIQIQQLDARIAAFETATITDPADASADYPFDRERLKKELLDEVLALMILTTRDLQSIGTVGPSWPGYDASDFLYSSTAFAKLAGARAGATDTQWIITYNLTGSPAGGISVFDNDPNGGNLTLYFGNASSRTSARSVYNAYATLIDAAFAAGDAFGNPAVDPSLVASSITPITVGGATYDRIASYSDVTQKDGEGNPLLTQYLVRTDVPYDISAGGTALSGGTYPDDAFVELDLQEATAGTSGTFTKTADSTAFTFTLTADGGVQVKAGTTVLGNATRVSVPLSVAYGANQTTPPADANLPLSLDAYRFTYGGRDYLVGVSELRTRVFLTGLTTSDGPTVGVKTLTPAEYLVHWNEARIQVLTGQLNFQQVLLSEIQTDLEQANDALAELQQQYALLKSDSDTSVPTLALVMFNATHATAGEPFSAPSQGHRLTRLEWDTYRTAIKNYIDRRTSESQQVTLDYQSTLDRYNGAYEVMSKLQDKLDDMIKGYLRNF